VRATKIQVPFAKKRNDNSKPEKSQKKPGEDCEERGLFRKMGHLGCVHKITKWKTSGSHTRKKFLTRRDEEEGKKDRKGRHQFLHEIKMVKTETICRRSGKKNHSGRVGGWKGRGGTLEHPRSVRSGGQRKHMIFPSKANGEIWPQIKLWKPQSSVCAPARQRNQRPSPERSPQQAEFNVSFPP